MTALKACILYQPLYHTNNFFFLAYLRYITVCSLAALVLKVFSSTEYFAHTQRRVRLQKRVRHFVATHVAVLFTSRRPVKLQRQDMIFSKIKKYATLSSSVCQCIYCKTMYRLDIFDCYLVEFLSDSQLKIN